MYILFGSLGLKVTPYWSGILYTWSDLGIQTDTRVEGISNSPHTISLQWHPLERMDLPPISLTYLNTSSLGLTLGSSLLFSDCILRIPMPWGGGGKLWTEPTGICICNVHLQGALLPAIAIEKGMSRLPPPALQPWDWVPHFAKPCLPSLETDLPQG